MQSKIRAECRSSERLGYREPWVPAFLFWLRLVCGDCGRCGHYSASCGSVYHCALVVFAAMVLVNALLCAEREVALSQRWQVPSLGTLSWRLVWHHVQSYHLRKYFVVVLKWQHVARSFSNLIGVFFNASKILGFILTILQVHLN